MMILLLLLGCATGDDPDGPLTVSIEGELTKPNGKTVRFKGTDKVRRVPEDGWTQVLVWSGFGPFHAWGVHLDTPLDGWGYVEAGESYSSGAPGWLAKDVWDPKARAFVSEPSTTTSDGSVISWGDAGVLGIGCIRDKGIEGGLEGCSIDTYEIRAHTFDVSSASESGLSGKFVARFGNGALLDGTIDVSGLQSPELGGWASCTDIPNTGACVAYDTSAADDPEAAAETWHGACNNWDDNDGSVFAEGECPEGNAVARCDDGQGNIEGTTGKVPVQVIWYKEACDLITLDMMRDTCEGSESYQLGGLFVVVGSCP